VFHAARQDLEIFFHLSGAVPQPLFDTQVAAMVCGFGDSASYETLVRKLAGAQLDKASRFTDWSHRPLTNRQIEYALGDVVHLRTVYERLQQRLAKNGRTEWFAEEMRRSPRSRSTAPTRRRHGGGFACAAGRIRNSSRCCALSPLGARRRPSSATCRAPRPARRGADRDRQPCAAADRQLARTRASPRASRKASSARDPRRGGASLADPDPPPPIPQKAQNPPGSAP